MKAKTLCPDEIQRIRDSLTHTDDPYAPRDRALFEIGLNCGLRRAEIVALNVGQVQEHDKIVARLELTETKGGKHRAVPINSHTRTILADYMAWKRDNQEALDKDAPLFVSRHGQRLGKRQASNRLQSIFRAAQIPGHATTHTLRRTFASRLNAMSFSARGIQLLLGHAHLNTTQQYLDVDEKRLEDAVEALF